MSDETGRDDFAHVGDVTLFDLMYETGTLLRGRLIALERAAAAIGDEVAQRRWREQCFAVARERDGIGGRDRAAQAAAIVSWGAERDALPVPPAVDSL